MTKGAKLQRKRTMKRLARAKTLRKLGDVPITDPEKKSVTLVPILRIVTDFKRI